MPGLCGADAPSFPYRSTREPVYLQYCCFSWGVKEGAGLADIGCGRGKRHGFAHHQTAANLFTASVAVHSTRR